MTGPVHRRPIRCLSCRYDCDVASGLTTAGSPNTGDVTICLNCGLIMVFTPFGVRHPTPEEQAEVMDDPVVAKSIAYIQARGFIPGYRGQPQPRRLPPPRRTELGPAW